MQVRERKKESVESDEESGDRRWGERRVLRWGEGLSPEISSTGSGLTARTGLPRRRNSTLNSAETKASLTQTDPSPKLLHALLGT